MAPFAREDRDAARPAARVPARTRACATTRREGRRLARHLPPGRARAVHRPGRLHPGDRQPHVHGRRQQRARVGRRRDRVRGAHPRGLHVRRGARVDPLRARRASCAPDVHGQGRDAPHPATLREARGRRSTASWSSAGRGSRRSRWTSARRWRTWRPSARRAAGHLRGRRGDASRGSPRAGPAPTRDAIRAQLRRARPGRATTPAACTRSTSSTIEPMVAHPGDPDRGIPSDPTNGALIAELGDVKIDIAYGGSCTAGKERRPRHLRARPARGRSRPAAASRRACASTSSSAARTCATTRAQTGYLELFERAGVEVIKPGCGACIGCGPGVSETPDQVTVSARSTATTRGAAGRAGSTSPRRSPSRRPPSTGRITAWRKGLFRRETRGGRAMSRAGPPGTSHGRAPAVEPAEPPDASLFAALARGGAGRQPRGRRGRRVRGRRRGRPRGAAPRSSSCCRTAWWSAARACPASSATRCA